MRLCFQSRGFQVPFRLIRGASMNICKLNKILILFSCVFLACCAANLTPSKNINPDSTQGATIPKPTPISGQESTEQNVTQTENENPFAFCNHDIPLLPDGMPAAENILVNGERTAEYLVAPSHVNVPSDIVVMDNGKILIAASRSNAILELLPDGTISSYVTLMAYSLDTDQQGNLYAYFFPSGDVYQISPNRQIRSVARMPETACESTIAVHPDGQIFVGLNHCGAEVNVSGIYAIPAGGGEPKLLINNNQKGVQVLALDVDKQGSLYALLDRSLNEVDIHSGDARLVATLPDWPSFHGLTISDNGLFYVSTGDFSTGGKLYQVDPGGQVNELAKFANNGLEGLAVTRQGEVIGVQRAIGGVQLVKQDGTVSALVKPNGLTTPQTLAFSNCGELFIVNDEGGRLTVATPDGNVTPSFQIISFQPPQTYLAFSASGWFVTGESAPGFPSKVMRYLNDGTIETITEEITWASGVAVSADDNVFISATESGQIIRITSNSESGTFAEGLQSPQSLTFDPTGSLYVVTGGQRSGGVFSIPMMGDTIQKISKDGNITTIASIQNAAQITCGPDSWIYVAAGNYVYRLNDHHEKEVVASGFQSARGVAFDRNGNLFVADENDNSIILIRHTFLENP
jgi:sugar lactone lactonase YvrE